MADSQDGKKLSFWDRQIQRTRKRFSKVGLEGGGRKIGKQKGAGRGKDGVGEKIVVELGDTLKKFGYAQDFDVQKYIASHYKMNSAKSAEMHLLELQARRQVTSDALKQFVYEKYTSFIDTAKEITNIESDMARLSGMLEEFKQAMAVVENTTLEYPDVALIARDKADGKKKKTGPGGDTNGMNAELALEELAEDLRSLVYERKLEKAVQTIESAFEKGVTYGEEPKRQAHSSPSVVGGSLASAASPSSSFSAPLSIPYHGSLRRKGSGSDATLPSGVAEIVHDYPSLAVDGHYLLNRAIKKKLVEDKKLSPAQDLYLRKSRENSRRKNAGVDVAGGRRTWTGEEDGDGFDDDPLDDDDDKEDDDVYNLGLSSDLDDDSDNEGSHSFQRWNIDKKGKWGAGSSRKGDSNSNSTSKDKGRGGQCGGDDGDPATAEKDSQGEVQSQSPGLLAAKKAIRERIDQLVEMLTFELMSNNLNTFQRRQIIGFLVRLRMEERALKVFLLSKSVSIKQEVKQIKFQGDIAVYVNDLAQVVFQGIGGAYSDFNRLFENDEIISGVTAWAVEEVESFTSLFHQQVYRSDESIVKLGKCLKYAYNACAMLEKKGVRLSFALARLFTPALLDAIKKNYQSVEKMVAEVLAMEEWKVLELWIHDPHPRSDALQETAAASSASTSSSSSLSSSAGAGSGIGTSTSSNATKRALRLTKSAQYLYEKVRGLLREVVPILDNTVYPYATSRLYPVVVSGMIRVFESYLLTMAQKAKAGVQTRTMSEAQSLAVISNAHCLADDLLPRVMREFKKQFNRPMPELESFRVKLNRLHEALQDSFAQKRAHWWILDILQWHNGTSATKRYSNPNPIQVVQDHEQGNEAGARAGAGACMPSPQWVNFAKHLVVVRGLILKNLNAQSVAPILALAVEETLRTLHETHYWTVDDKVHGHASNKGVPGFQPTLGGLQQLVFDLKFILASSGGYVNKHSEEAAESLTKRAVYIYNQLTLKGSEKKEKDDLLPSAKAYEATILRALRELKMDTIGSLLEYDIKLEDKARKDAEDRERQAEGERKRLAQGGPAGAGAGKGAGGTPRRSIVVANARSLTLGPRRSSLVDNGAGAVGASTLPPSR